MAKADDSTAGVGVDPIIAEARARWTRASEYEETQRERILAAKQFRAGDQWDPDIKAARSGKIALQGQAAQPGRPCLTIDRLSQPVRQVSNQIKTANFAIDVAPVSSDADKKTAQIVKGYLRRVQNQARDEAPVEWAADGALEGGLGWFRLRTEYVIESPDEAAGIEAFDQEPRLERIKNNLTVYDDPSAQKPTRSDALFRFVTEDLDREVIEDRWKEDIYGNPITLRSLDDFSGTGDPIGKEWVTKDKIRVAEYWRVTFTEEKWAQLQDLTVLKVDKFPKDAKATRTVRRPHVEMFKITACQILEHSEWPGSRIPLVPIIGEELDVDGQTILRGMISEGMDAQRMVNYTYSGAMETFALAPKSPFVAAAGQIDPYKEIWQTANTYNYSYLPYEPVAIGGQTLPPPQRENTEPPIQAAVELMRVSEEAIKATTGYYDSGLGAHDTRVLSGRAKQSEIQQSELGSANYGDGVMRALIYAGELMLEILPKITRKGQIIHILGLDDQPQQVMVGQPFQPDKQGIPQPLNIHPDQMAQMEEGVAQFYDLTKGRYAVTVKVGKASATKREEGAAALGELIPHLPPEMAAVATPDYVEQLDFEGSHQIAEKLRKALPPQLQDQKEGQPDPEKMALMQKVQQLQQALEGKHAEEMAKQQASMQEAQMKAQTDLQKAQLDRQTRLDIAQIQANASIASAEVKSGSDDLDRRLKLIELFLTADKEKRLDAESQLHEHARQDKDHAHEAALTGMEQAHERDMAQMGHEQALEQGAQAAALQPSGNGNGAAE